MADVSEEPQTSPAPTGRRRLWIGVGIAAIVVIALIVWAVVSGTGSGEPSASGTGTPTPSASASADASPTPTASAEPSVEPTDDAQIPDDVTIDETGREILNPVPIDARPSPKAGVTVAITNIEAVDGIFVMPGEVAGPALRVTVDVVNDNTTAQRLDLMVMNLYYGAGLTPAETLSQPGGAPLTGEIAPGATATGVYLFRVPVDQRGNIRIEVDLETSARVLLFEGAFQ